MEARENKTQEVEKKTQEVEKKTQEEEKIKIPSHQMNDSWGLNLLKSRG